MEIASSPWGVVRCWTASTGVEEVALQEEVRATHTRTGPVKGEHGVCARACRPAITFPALST